MAQAISNVAPKNPLQSLAGKLSVPANNFPSSQYKMDPRLLSPAKPTTGIITPPKGPQTPVNGSAPQLPVSPPAQQNVSGLGSYKGVTINPGSQAQVQSQVRSIDTPVQAAIASQPAQAPTSFQQAQSTPPQTTPSTSSGVRGVLSYPGLVGGLVSHSQASSPVAGQAASGLIQNADQNTLQKGAAYDIYERALKERNELQKSIAQTKEGIYSAPTSARIMQGRDQATQVANAETLRAAEERVSQAQQALGYGLQQQQVQQAGLTSAGSLGLQGQGLLQSGLTSAAGLAPEALRFEAFGGSSLSPQARASELAQQVQSGLISPQAAEQQMSSLYGGAGATFLNQALQGGGYNYNVGSAQAAAQQSNVQQQGTAQTDIARQGLQQATNDYVALTGAAQFAGQQSHAVTNILAQAGLNNVSSTDYNKALNNLKSRFGDTNFAALNTALIEARSAYANLLSTSGQTPTGNESQALATLDISQPASAINASMQELENAVARRLQAANTVRSQFEQNLGGGGNAGGGYAPTGGGQWDW